MQIFGLGLTESHWKVIFQNIQKALSHQNDHTTISIPKNKDSLKVKARLLSQSEILPESIINTCEAISKSPPDLFLLTPQGFKTFTDCLFFISQLQTRIPQEKTSYGLIIENIEKDLSPFISYNPEVILTNNMRFTVSDPSLFLKKAIQRFPRIQIKDSDIRIEYLGLNDRVINQSLEEIPINRLISLNQIKRVYTEQGELTMKNWLARAVEQQEKSVEFSQIKGVLKEKQGVYLFPGIPLERVATMILGDIRIHFILFYDRLNQRSNSFKRMVAQLKIEKPPFSTSDIHQKNIKPLRCLGGNRIINQFTEIFLSNMGIDDFRFIENLSNGTHTLEDSILWLQLEKLDSVTLQGNYLNLMEPLQNVTQQLNSFVNIADLTIISTFSKDPLTQIEFIAHRKQLMKEEKLILGEQRLAENKYLLYTQEKQVLKEASKIAQKLTQFLANSFLYDEVIAKKYKIDSDQVLFFCEEQEQAYELNQELVHISKKLWINPMDYQTPDQLNQLNMSTIGPYAEKGVIIITSGAMYHLETLCNEIFERLHSISKDGVLQKQVIEQSQVEFEYLQRQKQEHALHWIYVSLKQLFNKNKSFLLQETNLP